MNKPLLMLLIALSPIISAVANPTPPAEITNLIHDKASAASKIEELFNAVYKGENTHLVDNSVFSPYSSGDHRYLIAKAYITFYNENVRQQVWGILLDVDSGWIFSITEKQLDYFVRTGDRTYLPHPPNLDPNAGLQPPDNSELTEPSKPPTPAPVKSAASFIIALRIRK